MVWVVSMIFVRLSIVHKLVVAQLLYNLSWLLMFSISCLYKLASLCLSLAESVHVAAEINIISSHKIFI